MRPRSIRRPSGIGGSGTGGRPCRSAERPRAGTRSSCRFRLPGTPRTTSLNAGAGFFGPRTSRRRSRPDGSGRSEDSPTARGKRLIADREQRDVGRREVDDEAPRRGAARPVARFDRELVTRSPRGPGGGTMRNEISAGPQDGWLDGGDAGRGRRPGPSRSSGSTSRSCAGLRSSRRDVVADPQAHGREPGAAPRSDDLLASCRRWSRRSSGGSRSQTTLMSCRVRARRRGVRAEDDAQRPHDAVAAPSGKSDETSGRRRAAVSAEPLELTDCLLAAARRRGASRTPGRRPGLRRS